jgi:hypothetical protein
MPKIFDSKLNTLAQQLVADGRLSTADVNQLIDAAMENKDLSSAQGKELKAIASSLADRLDSPEAKQRLLGFIGIVDKSIRNLAYSVEKEKGIIDTPDAKQLVDLARRNVLVSTRDRLSLQSVMIAMRLTPAARAELEAALGPPTPSVPTIDLKLPPILGRTYVLSPDGYLTTGSGAPPSFDENGALTLYRAAMALSRADGVPFATVPTAIKEKLVAHLEKAFAAGQEDRTLPQIPKQRMRSGAATILSSLIEGCGASDAAVRQRALDLYFKQATAEPLGGLRASMYFNLARLESTLSAVNKAALGTLAELVIPTKPPYDLWLKDGKRELHVMHYAHEDCWKNGADPIAAYQTLGFKVVEAKTDSKPKRWLLEGVNDKAPGGPLKVKVEIKQTHDGIFQSMDDPDNHVILYTGHSNLGGNVSEELRLGPAEKGQKLILLAMCRGKQNMFEVANKYSASHFITTNSPSFFSSVMPVAMGVIDGVMNLRDYDGIRAHTQPISDTGQIDNYFYPNQARRFALYDMDQDGVVDGKGEAIDRLYNVGLTVPAGTKVDGVPRVNDYTIEDLEGSKVVHAVQFLNTLMTYHVDHGHNSSSFKAGDMDSFLSGGWFDGPLTELVRLTKRKVDGSDMVKVEVNKALADQAWPVIGALVQFETVKLLAKERNNGKLSDDDNARAMLFAGEYLAYMYCSFEEAEAAMKAIGKIAGKAKLGYDVATKAVEADGDGYVTDTQMRALLAAI